MRLTPVNPVSFKASLIVTPVTNDEINAISAQLGQDSLWVRLPKPIEKLAEPHTAIFTNKEDVSKLEALYQEKNEWPHLKDCKEAFPELKTKKTVSGTEVLRAIEKGFFDFANLKILDPNEVKKSLLSVLKNICSRKKGL